MTAKSLEQSFVYKQMNQGNGISTAIGQVLTKGIRLTKENLEEAFLIINKNFKYPLKYKVMEEFNAGKIILMYSPPDVRIPTAMPFFLTRDGHGNVVSVIVVDLYGKMDPETKNVNIDPKKLYCVMEAAQLARTYYDHSMEIPKRNVIITSGSSIYANMFTRVLNKKYALNVDRTKMHKVLLLASKFYMINVLGMADNEMTFNYASRNCPNANLYSLKEANDILKPEDYLDLSTFIQALTKTELGLKMDDLTVRGFMEQYINMYDASTLFALEMFPYFMFTVVAVVEAAYLNRHFVLEDIVDKHGAKLYNDLMIYNR